MVLYRIFFFLASLALFQPTLAQGGASVKASVDKNKILIGEPMTLTVEVYQPPGAAVTFVTIDSIDHFEFSGTPVMDTISGGGGTSIKGIYKITSFDSGHWVIPSFILTATAKSDTIPVDIIFSEFDPNQDYHEIKDIIEVKPVSDKRSWWYAAGAALLLVLLLLYLLRKKKPRPVSVIQEIVNPYEEAIKQLDRLQTEKPDAKQYHSRLTDIFRLYIFRKKGILSLQKTTDDLVLQLRNLDLERGQFDRLAQALRLSDFVKFAKYIPSAGDDNHSFEEIKNAIITIEKLIPASPSPGRN